MLQSAPGRDRVSLVKATCPFPFLYTPSCSVMSLLCVHARESFDYRIRSRCSLPLHVARETTGSTYVRKNRKSNTRTRHDVIISHYSDIIMVADYALTYYNIILGIFRIHAHPVINPVQRKQLRFFTLVLYIWLDVFMKSINFIFEFLIRFDGKSTQT